MGKNKPSKKELIPPAKDNANPIRFEIFNTHLILRYRWI